MRLRRGGRGDLNLRGLAAIFHLNRPGRGSRWDIAGNTSERTTPHHRLCRASVVQVGSAAALLYRNRVRRRHCVAPRRVQRRGIRGTL